MPPKSSKMDDAFLISVVERYEELYNLHHPQYLNQQRRDSIWEEIGSIMKHDSYICKERWARIRDNFRKALNLRRTKTGKVACKIKAPRFNKELSFLIPYFTDDDNKQSNKSDSETDDETSTVKVDLHNATRPKSPSFASAYMPLYSPDCDEQNSNLYLTSREISRFSASRNHDSDPLMDFFLTMGRTVKTFPLKEQVRIKGEIFKIVNSTEMRLASSMDQNVIGKSSEKTLSSVIQLTQSRPLETSSPNTNVKTELMETELAILTEHESIGDEGLESSILCSLHPYNT